MMIDFVIILAILIVIAIIIYFVFWKNRNNPCKGCSYYKKCKECQKKNIDNDIH